MGGGEAEGGGGGEDEGRKAAGDRGGVVVGLRADWVQLRKIAQEKIGRGGGLSFGC